MQISRFTPKTRVLGQVYSVVDGIQIAMRKQKRVNCMSFQIVTSLMLICTSLRIRCGPRSVQMDVRTRARDTSCSPFVFLVVSRLISFAKAFFAHSRTRCATKTEHEKKYEKKTPIRWSDSEWRLPRAFPFAITRPRACKYVHL